MSNEMIERVARAMCLKRMPLHPSLDADRYWQTHGSKRVYIELARAAIEAMREPTNEMLGAFQNGHELGAWHEAIARALKVES